MEKIAEGVSLITGRPRYAWNCYVVDNVLVDCGTRWSHKTIVRDLGDFALKGLILTHAHPDHLGSASHLGDLYHIPILCGAADKDIAENGRWSGRLKRRFFFRFLDELWMGPKPKISGILREGDEIGDFRIVEIPGHTAGSIALWRECDRVLILGDALLNIDPFSGKSLLRRHLSSFIEDRDAYERSLKRLADLDPLIVCFGHGKPLHDGHDLGKLIAEKQ